MQVKLNNQAEVLDWRLRPGGVGEREVVGKVLARRTYDAFEPYVTWEIASDDGENFDVWSGHYFKDITRAEDDFQSRRLP